MKNENKCFFSISLENGIVITGANPYEVREFLRSCHVGAIYAEDATIKEHPLAARQWEKFGYQVLNAICTINNNSKED